LAAALQVHNKSKSKLLRAMCYTQRCDNLTTVVGRTKLTTLATPDVTRRNFFKSIVCDIRLLPEGSTLIIGDTLIPFKTV